MNTYLPPPIIIVVIPRNPWLPVRIRTKETP